ncbi:MAG: hypothetical protein Q8N91_03190 [Candidatus Omnitrophota bacterium]|nr:hypothetical protein [Candidatus Omnitrophota bacterium]
MRTVFFVLLSLVLAIGLIGCNISKPYVITKDRVDQELGTGNKGYLVGTPPPEKDRGDLKRPFIAIDIDFPEIKGKATQQTKIVEGNTPFCPVAKAINAVTYGKASEENIK